MQLPPQDAILFEQICPGRLLLPIQPADQRGERDPQEQRVNHGGSLSHRPKCSLAKQVGRVMGHYGFTSSGVARRSEQVLVRRVGVGDCPEDKMASSPHEHRQ